MSASDPPDVNPASLPPVPTSLVDPRGQPRFGRYRGSPESSSLADLVPPHRPGLLGRFFAHKRWCFVTAATPQVIVGLAIVDLGYAANAFVYALDLIDHEPLVDHSTMGLPLVSAKIGEQPGEGLKASFRGGGLRADLFRPVGAPACIVDVELSPDRTHAGLHWQGTLVVADAASLSVVAPVERGFVNYTHKLAGLPTDGELVVGAKQWSLDGGTGGSDYTNGLLARHTAWRWAMASGRLPDGSPIGFNLVEGFNERGDLNENALWIGGEPLPLPGVTFRCTEDGWRIRAEDESVNLRFHAFHEHLEQRDLLLVRSNFRQSVGVFQGCFRRGRQVIEIESLAGVAEDQDVLW